MLSRNRSTCGVRPYIRATTNPDADSWVSELIAWWIDQETGVPIAARGGVIRWFARINDALVWDDSKAGLQAMHPECEPKSLTFVPASLADNAILMAADPGYRANLMALPAVERGRLLGGNWKIRPAAGMYFRRQWCQVVDAVPYGTREVRGWDLAATKKTESNDPDFSCGTKIGKCPDGSFIVLHHLWMQEGPMEVERALCNTAAQDGKAVRIAIPQDPAQGGKWQAQTLTRLLAGYEVRSSVVRGEKTARFGPFSAQAEAGNVKVLRGPWNERWFSALEAFPDAKHDDDADSTAEAFNLLAGGQVIPIVVPFVHTATRTY